MILIADDEAVNRFILGNILEDEYEILYADDGIEALDKIRSNADILSLVLLDIMMPGMTGLEVLKSIKQDALTRNIPAIVVTSDQDAEVESLRLGAADFIPKPYPRDSVISARIRRTIEFSEDKDILNHTERDPLTGLYNREFFYRYAEQFDNHHRDVEMDAMVIDINRFHMINERFGNSYGDEILKRIGERVREMVADSDGIVCRREADTFMIYCPSGKDYQAILDSASVGLAEDDAANSRVRLRMGVYANVDKTMDIERRFDRAKMAADTVRNSFTRAIGIYDSAMHEKELYNEQLIEEFHTAIEEKQFHVFYQPKFDIVPDIPVLASAEALVRWIHPEFGMISPGVFIPLFEENGLIQTLDHFVWRTAAAQIKDWKDRLGFTVPVSVNVSRIDMYDPDMIKRLQDVVKENGISPNEILLEITESAYTQDSERIIETVNELRALGFRIEMDDFGTGYSSLNMISTLPIDALKLDMQFIRTAFTEGGDTRMIEVIVDIADYLGVPVIAEGVETAEQLDALREMGCDLVQGYYFSKPVPAGEYEKFVIACRDNDGDEPKKHEGHRERSFSKIVHALSAGFSNIYYVDTENNHYVEFTSEGSFDDLQIERSGADFFADMENIIIGFAHPDDKVRAAMALHKTELLSRIRSDHPFSLNYRKVINGEVSNWMLKAAKASTHDDHHIVVGLSCMDNAPDMDSSEMTYLHDDLTFGGLARALSSDMESIYIIDPDTGSYLEFRSDSPYGKLELEISGSDFFGECRRNIQSVVYREDRGRVATALDREALINALEDRSPFVMIYRLIMNGSLMYYRLKAVWDDQVTKKHIIIGVSNINSQITDAEKKEAELMSNVTYSSIAKALSQDYFSIYYVDTETDHFIEYSSDDEYDELGIEKDGDDFFEMSRLNIVKVIHPDDQKQFLDVFTKDNIMCHLANSSTFTHTYRLMMNGIPTYVHMKITRMAREDKHIVVGVSNVDQQIRREQEHNRALRMANRDALTGVKSKHAYIEAEDRINEDIRNGSEGEFAVAVCDLNDLKLINDTKGHKAGDEYIVKACQIICKVFDHSPVFRIGGDEFVAILRNSDYENRAELRDRIGESNSSNTDGVIIACGIAEFDKERDSFLADVFERADEAMYNNKKELKNR